jgi:hypothetical protein
MSTNRSANDTKKELRLTCAPADFEGMLFMFRGQLLQEYGVEGRYIFVVNPLQQGVVNVEVLPGYTLGPPAKLTTYGLGVIGVHRRGDNGSQLVFTARDPANWPRLLPWWERLRAELTRLGMVHEAEPAQAERAADAPKKRGPVGRRRDPDNEWAYQQVNEIGRTPAEVYPEWAQRRRGHETLKQLDDPLDSFKHAIATRKK